jgi:hypothetical protein
MQQRRRTAAQWASENPVLAEGELGVDTTGMVTKMGDGTRTWTALPAVAAFTGHDAFYLWAVDMAGGDATYTQNSLSSSFPSYWLFDQTTPERVKFVWTPPIEWTAFVGRIGFIAPGTGGNNVVWRWSHYALPLGGNPATAMSVLGTATMAGPAGFGSAWTYGDLAGSVGSPIDISSGGVMLSEIERVAGDGSDTLAGDAALVVVTMTSVPT